MAAHSIPDRRTRRTLLHLSVQLRTAVWTERCSVTQYQNGHPAVAHCAHRSDTVFHRHGREDASATCWKYRIEGGTLSCLDRPCARRLAVPSEKTMIFLDIESAGHFLCPSRLLS
jgi:hypothetical protein